MKIEHNCRQCKNEWLGRCFSYCNYGRVVSVNDEICPCFIDGRNPKEVTFVTVWQLENYLREFFYVRDFCQDFTRLQLKNILRLLYPHIVKENGDNRVFSNMCKKRMIKHIEFYIKLHNLKCKSV